MVSQIRIRQHNGLWCVTWVEPRYRRPARWWQWHRDQAIAWDHVGELAAKRRAG